MTFLKIVKWTGKNYNEKRGERRKKGRKEDTPEVHRSSDTAQTISSERFCETNSTTPRKITIGDQRP